MQSLSSNQSNQHLIHLVSRFPFVPMFMQKLLKTGDHWHKWEYWHENWSCEWQNSEAYEQNCFFLTDVQWWLFVLINVSQVMFMKTTNFPIVNATATHLYKREIAKLWPKKRVHDSTFLWYVYIGCHSRQSMNFLTSILT